MLKKLSLVILCFVGLAGSLAQAGGSEGRTPLIFNLRGLGVLVPGSEVPAPADAPVPAGAGCYKTDIYDLARDRRIGTGYDCLEVLGTASSAGREGEPDGTGVRVRGTTYFVIDRAGVLVTQGLTTVQPILHGTPDFTHITGALPTLVNPASNIVGGSGRFDGASGPVRLSGAVNMSDATGKTIRFDCLFVIRLDKRQRHPRD